MKKTLFGTAAAAFFAAFLCAPAPVFAGLTITPTLVVIEGRDRGAEVNLINNGEDIQPYSIGWKFLRQEEVTGAYIETNAPMTDFDLTKNLIFTPKRVTLPPNELQKIRLGLRLKGQPPAPGDYRGHLEFREINPPLPPDQIDKNSHQGKAGVGVRINVGFSIPVVYRVGEPDVRAAIGDISTQINPNTKKIELVVPVSRVPKESKFGLLGHFKIYYGDDVVGELKNANIYPEVGSRVFKLPLNVTALNGGTVRVVYTDYKDNNDGPAVLAEKSMKVGKQ